ncbi:MAG: hypothetical protein ACYC1C_20445, partial [Chloroflexota bacterium]
NHNDWDGEIPGAGTSTFLLTDIIRLQSARLGVSLPPIAGTNLIYDNGDSQLYRERPLTPFQR